MRSVRRLIRRSGLVVVSLMGLGMVGAGSAHGQSYGYGVQPWGPSPGYSYDLRGGVYRGGSFYPNVRMNRAWNYSSYATPNGYYYPYSYQSGGRSRSWPARRGLRLDKPWLRQ